MQDGHPIRLDKTQKAGQTTGRIPPRTIRLIKIRSFDMNPVWRGKINWPSRVNANPLKVFCLPLNYLVDNGSHPGVTGRKIFYNMQNTNRHLSLQINIAASIQSMETTGQTYQGERGR